MIKKIARHRAAASLSAIAIALVGGGFAWALVAVSSSGSGPFIMHFNDMTGITSVGDLSAVIFIGIVGLVVTIMNFFISLEFEERDAFLGKIVVGGSLIFSILLFIAFAAILNVN
jgi:hypothetical protein